MNAKLFIGLWTGKSKGNVDANEWETRKEQGKCTFDRLKQKNAPGFNREVN